MGEIKSTLDLVMEKTKHLTLSQEEKDAQNRMEVNKKLKGLLQKYQDGLLKMEQLKKELETLRKNYNVKIDETLSSLLLDGLELGASNTMCLELLYGICGRDVKKLETIFNDYRDTLKTAAEKRITKIKENLAKKHFISGSAVVPHLDADDEWMATFREINDRFDQALSQEKAALTGSLSL